MAKRVKFELTGKVAKAKQDKLRRVFANVTSGCRPKKRKAQTVANERTREFAHFVALRQKGWFSLF